MVDNINVPATIDGGFIEPSKAGIIRMDLSGISQGQHKIIVISKGYSQSGYFIHEGNIPVYTTTTQQTTTTIRSTTTRSTTTYRSTTTIR